MKQPRKNGSADHPKHTFCQHLRFDGMEKLSEADKKSLALAIAETLSNALRLEHAAMRIIIQ